MADVFWPGDERAGDLFSQRAFIRAMLEVETAWLAEASRAGLAPCGPVDVGQLLEDDDCLDGVIHHVAEAAEPGGNPLIPLLGVVRERLSAEGPNQNLDAAAWLHKGMTSQDAIDTALMLCAAQTLDRIDAALGHMVQALATLADEYRTTIQIGRTLTQHAVPITFGLKVAGWLGGVIRAGRALRAVRAELPAQFGGAAGSRAATAELFAQAGHSDPTNAADQLAASAAHSVKLNPVLPWHTARTAITRIGDVLTTVTDALGHMAADVATLSRPEIGEVREANPGGSSTMPNKANPVMSVLIRRAAIAGPGLASTLHTAAALANDERPDGAWHVEWSTLSTLARRTVVAASQAQELTRTLTVNTESLTNNLESAGQDVLAERRSMVKLAGGDPNDNVQPAQYVGSNDTMITSALEDADAYLQEE